MNRQKAKKKKTEGEQTNRHSEQNTTWPQLCRMLHTHRAFRVISLYNVMLMGKVI